MAESYGAHTGAAPPEPALWQPDTAYGPDRPRTPNTPELVAMHDALQRAFADPERPAESLAEQRAELWRIAGAGSADPSLTNAGRQAIGEFLSVVDYLWFGGCEDMPPPPLEVGIYEYFYEITFPGSLQSSISFDSARHFLAPRGLSDLLTRRDAFLHRNMSAVDAAYQELVASVTTSRWLRSFQVGQIFSERPLPPHEALSREAAEAAYARRRFGVQAEGDVRLHPQARHAAVLPVHRVSGETSRGIRPQQGDQIAPARLERFVRTSAMTALPDTVVSIVFDEGTDLYECRDATGAVAYTFETEDILPDLRQALGIPRAPNENIYYLACGLFNDVYAGILKQPDSITGQFGAGQVDDLRESFLDFWIEGFRLNKVHVGHALNGLKFSPDDAPFIMPQTAKMDLSLRYNVVTRPGHGTKEEADALRAIVIGSVEKRHDPEPVPGAIRLLQYLLFETTIPIELPSGVEPDMVLRLSNRRAMPYVPGYELIAADVVRGWYYFAYRPDKDPYAGPHPSIEAGAQQEIARQVAEAHLPGYAREVRRMRAPNLGSLALSLQAHSEYTYRNPAAPDLSDGIDSLPGFGALVHGRGLRTTCGLYATFGRFCADIALGPGRAFVTGGHVIRSGKIITAVQHAQLAIRGADGRVRSLTDWTPPVGVPGPSLRSALARQKPYILPAQPQPAVNTMERGHVANSGATLRTMHEDFMLQLRIIFLSEIGAADISRSRVHEAIYAKLRALGEGHPITATARALLRASSVAGPPQTSQGEPAAAERVSANAASELLNALSIVRQHRQAELRRLLSAQAGYLDTDAAKNQTALHDMLEDNLTRALRVLRMPIPERGAKSW